MTTVLIVDDEELNTRLIQLYLKDTGYETVTASDGLEGWDQLQQLHDKIDVVLLDMNYRKGDMEGAEGEQQHGDQAAGVPAETAIPARPTLYRAPV